MSDPQAGTMQRQPRFSINQLTTYRWTFEQDIAEFLAAGIATIGVWRQKLADHGDEAGIRLLLQSEMTVSNLLWAGGFTGSDGRTYAESLQDAIAAVRLAHAMRARCLVVYSGGRNGHTQNHARRLFASALNELLPLAAELDVRLAVEPMHPGCAEEWTFLNSIDDALSLIDAVGSPLVKVAFDTYHMGHDPQVVEKIRRLAGQIAIVHLGDSHGPPEREQNRVRLGTGKVPLQEIVAAIEDTGYAGCYDVELLGEEIESGCYRRLIADSKATFEELLAAAPRP
jgi:sugar phosphate isomerase/epimerase